MFPAQWQKGMNALAIFAHPDDAELIAYGSLRKIAQDGGKVSLVVATNGSEGRRVDESRDETLANQRRRETCLALRLVTEDVTFLDFADGHVSVDGTLISVLERIINEQKPTVIFTHFICQNGVDHQDHTAIGKAVINIAWRKSFVKYVLAGEPIIPNTAFHPNTLFDVTEHFDEKCSALSHHRSQQGRAYLEREFHLNRARRWSSMNLDGKLYESYRLEKALIE